MIIWEEWKKFDRENSKDEYGFGGTPWLSFTNYFAQAGLAFHLIIIILILSAIWS